MGVSWLNFEVGSGLVALQVGLLAAVSVRDLEVLGDWSSISCPDPAASVTLLLKSWCCGARGGVAAVSTTKGGGRL